MQAVVVEVYVALAFVIAAVPVVALTFVALITIGSDSVAVVIAA